MATSLEGRMEKPIQNLFSKLCTDKAGWNTKYIGIVVLSRKACQFFQPADGSAYVLMFVGCDGNSIGAAANQHTKICLFCFNRRCNRMCKIRIIHGSRAVRAKIFY